MGTRKLFIDFMSTIDSSSITKMLGPIFTGIANRKSMLPTITTTSTWSIMVTTGTQTNSKELLGMEPYTLSKNMKVKKEDMIPVNADVFMYRKTKNDGVTKRSTDTKPGNSSVKAKRAVKDIIKAIDNTQLTDEQKVLVVKTASVYPRLRNFLDRHD